MNMESPHTPNHVMGCLPTRGLAPGGCDCSVGFACCWYNLALDRVEQVAVQATPNEGAWNRHRNLQKKCKKEEKHDEQCNNLVRVAS